MMLRNSVFTSLLMLTFWPHCWICQGSFLFFSFNY